MLRDGRHAGQAPGTLLQFYLDYPEKVPDGFTMTFAVTGEREGEEKPGSAAPGADQSIADEMLSPPTVERQEILAEFTFDLTFDPLFTDPGEVIPVNETFQMDGQTFTITEVEIYPTQLRLNVEGDPDNTAWLKGLYFYLENEDGERFDTVTNGITATGDEDTPAMVSFRLESPYFSDSNHLTLYITGARWLEKDHERVYVDLAHASAPWLPEGVTLTSAQRREGGWFFDLPGGPHGVPHHQHFRHDLLRRSGQRMADKSDGLYRLRRRRAGQPDHAAPARLPGRRGVAGGLLLPLHHREYPHRPPHQVSPARTARPAAGSGKRQAPALRRAPLLFSVACQAGICYTNKLRTQMKRNGKRGGPMRILGIDPGVATIGFGLVEADRAQVHMVTYGAITTPAGLPLSRRLYQIDRDMEELIGKREADPIEYYISDDYIAVEGETSLKEIIATIDYDVSGIIPVIQHDRKLLGYLTKSIILATMSKQFVPEHTAGERSGVICPATL